MYAYPQGCPDVTDPANRIRADEHHGERALCPLGGCVVESRQRCGIWQWVHVKKRCHNKPEAAKDI